ncbi:MAG: transcriptional repressor [Candidatus Melainabacteria bacterium]|nr:transcriptional repressor [Candidatus Melainabacteria bacterium]MBI3308381.1 transcriptional repressor [Candidatus Melainabacteria bacterium]
MPIESIPETVFQNLRSKGLRITPQREKILQIFMELPESTHLSAEDLFKMLAGKNENISLATTYRTLKLLSQFGYLRELDFAEGHKHYELNKDKKPHHHIICLNCNKTLEFEDDLVNEVGYRIAAEKGVEIVDIQFKIYAMCPHEKDDESKTHRS